ncbi:MAG: hypothetical protein R2814_02090 [Flavobacteriaceae bacterium]
MKYHIEDYSHKDLLEMPEENMLDAVIMDVEDMSNDIIRLYSRVTLIPKSGWSETFQLMLPPEDNGMTNRFTIENVSEVYVMGRSEDDIIRYSTLIGLIPITITKVVQTGNNCATKIREDKINRGYKLG